MQKKTAELRKSFRGKSDGIRKNFLLRLEDVTFHGCTRAKAAFLKEKRATSINFDTIFSTVREEEFGAKEIQDFNSFVGKKSRKRFGASE